MFKMVQAEAYFWPVKVDIPVSGGKFEAQTFDAQFKLVSQARLNELLDLAKDDKMTPKDLLKEVVTGWRGVDSGSGELPFSEGALNQLLDSPCVAPALVDAFFESRRGAKRKN